MWKEDHGGWLYLPMDEATQEAGLETIKNYISRYQKKIYQYITTSPILYICHSKGGRTGAQVPKRWW